MLFFGFSFILYLIYNLPSVTKNDYGMRKKIFGIYGWFSISHYIKGGRKLHL